METCQPLHILALDVCKWVIEARILLGLASLRGTREQYRDTKDFCGSVSGLCHLNMVQTVASDNQWTTGVRCSIQAHTAMQIQDVLLARVPTSLEVTRNWRRVMAVSGSHGEGPFSLGG
jgi:hypothetical protein